MFSKEQLVEIEERGLTPEGIEEQLERFKRGFEEPELIAPATLKRGVVKFKPQRESELIDKGRSFRGEIIKFVPASGAATRMFKELYDGIKESNSSGEVRSGSEAASFLSQLKRYPFYDELSEQIELTKASDREILERVLFKEGLNYGNRPKGLIPFHKYEGSVRSAFEEHLFEAIAYAKNSEGVANLVLSVSEEHLELFKEIYNSKKGNYEREYNSSLNLQLGIQKPSTDRVAVDLNNNLILDREGKILFRPGGHGALIDNLNEIEGDIVVIKNIDNVVRQELAADTIYWKRVLIGALVELQEEIYRYLRALDGERDPDLIVRIKEFMRERLSITLPNIPEELEKEFLKAKLNRPIRVCGMVKNEGEPGGGPFFVKEADGSIALQIVEEAQLNMGRAEVAEIVKGATHFNPVDIVLSLKNYRGERFDLTKYIDHEGGFISNKSFEGERIKALELPGLWNGGMSNWNTLFVEVPITTFNPVKRVSDLLRASHTHLKAPL